MNEPAKYSELTFQLIVESTPSAMILINKEGKIVFANLQTEKLFGYSKSELIGRSIEILIPERFAQKHPGFRSSFFASPNARAMGAGRDLFARKNDGAEFPVEIGLNPVVTVEGTLVLAAVIDITERKKFEEQQTLFASIVNSSDDAIISKSLDGIITSWNIGAEKVFGFTQNEISGKHISILIPTTLQAEESEIMNKIRSGEGVDHYETTRIRKNGTPIEVSLTISPIKDSSGNIVGASKIARDITERKKGEEELLKVNRLYAFMSAINQSIVHIKDEAILLSNAADIAIKIGKFEAARIGMLDEQGKMTIISTTINEATNHWLQEYSGLDFGNELLRNTPVGKALRTGQYAVSNDMHNDVDLNPWREGMTENNIKASASFPIKKFEKIIGVFSFLSSEKDFFDEKEITLLQEAVGDISFALEVFEKDMRRKMAEEEIIALNESLEKKIAERTAQLQSANKELESFSYSVAHDLRSPLRGVHGYATMLKEDYSGLLDEEGKRLLGEVEYNAKKMGALIDDLLTFSKLGRKEIKKSLIDMNDLVGNSMAEINAAQTHHAKIKIAKLHPVMADASLMKHVITNLLSNAIKYSSKVESPVVEINSEKENEAIIYSVKDNGVGFDMEFAGKLFGVFQRLHSDEEFEGTGVGLAIAQRIVQRHEGKIWAQSKEGEGAVFYFSLPEIDKK